MIRDGLEHCDFCLKPRTLGILIAGETGAHICSDCVVNCMYLMVEVGNFGWKPNGRELSRMKEESHGETAKKETDHD